MSKNISVDSLAKQFEGRMFGELIVYKGSRTTREASIKALMGLSAQFPTLPKSAVTEWIDEYNVCAYDPYFWRKDCGVVYREVCGRAKDVLNEYDIKVTDDNLLSMAEIIFSNFVYSGYNDKRFIDFIKNSMEDVTDADGNTISAQAGMSALGHTITMNIISADGSEQKTLLIGDDISEKDCIAFIDPETNELYALKLYESGAPIIVMFRKLVWDMVQSEFQKIESKAKKWADKANSPFGIFKKAIGIGGEENTLSGKNKLIEDFYHRAKNNKEYDGIYKVYEFNK